MKVLFLTNIPSPYRVDFFNEFGKKVDLTVIFDGRKATDRDSQWVSEKAITYREIYLNGIRIGADQFFSLKILKYIKQNWDIIIIGGYSTVSAMLAIEYMRLHRIKFIISADGGLIPLRESTWKRRIKTHFISSASAWFSSGKATTDWLVYYGAKSEKCYLYPFTSLTQYDLTNAKKMCFRGKYICRKKLHMPENKKIALMVTRIIPGKGIDALLAIAERIQNTEYYVIGGKAPKWIMYDSKDKHKHVHFVNFKTKSELAEYYCAADIFVFPTHHDSWGLVINEAFSFGLPVITTNMCVAGLELVHNSETGYIVPVDDIDGFVNSIKNVEIENSNGEYTKRILKLIEPYSIENMAIVHKRALDVLYKEWYS